MAGIGLVLALVFTAFKGNDMLPIGAEAPMMKYEMQDALTGERHHLAGLKKENGLLVIFSCNTCPFVLAWEETYPGLGEYTRENNIGMVLVNSNEAKRKGEDSREAMQEHYKQGSYNTPYVIDEGHQLADAFGAKTTPHVFLFNSDMELVYRGSINDKFEERDKKADVFYLDNALKAMLDDAPVNPAETREIGCSIKRVKS
ncbi:MAG: redoxin domain-containing protein [Owenweeksia sp.]|nr:redoxin domain-containing protein [Owenweeksia sp.]